MTAHLEPLEPLDDQFALTPVARRTAARLLQLAGNITSGDGTADGAAREAVWVLRALSDEDLQGVQALGQLVAVMASSTREARRKGVAKRIPNT